MTTLSEYKRASLPALTALVAEHYDARESGTAAVPLHMGHLLHGLVWPDDAALSTPYSTDSEEAIDQVCARYNLVTDILAGKFGRCALLEAAFELEASLAPDAGAGFPDRDFAYTNLAVARTAMVHAGLYDSGASEEEPLDMRLVLNRLIHAKTQWADDLVVGLVSGRFGGHLQFKTASAMEAGMWDLTADVFSSVVRTCISNGRLTLLATLADQGMPTPLRQRGAGDAHNGASTETGQWLDVLSNYSSSGARTSFPRQVDAFRNSPAAVTLADILVKHDPNHKAIGAIKGTGGHAIIMESMMRARIHSLESGAAAVNDSPAEAAPARRRSRHI